MDLGRSHSLSSFSQTVRQALNQTISNFAVHNVSRFPVSASKMARAVVIVWCSLAYVGQIKGGG